MNINSGTLLNARYRITSVLGQGGMGAVYRAQDENLDIAVAVKENLFLTEEYSRQFQKEANILASLRHHNLPRVRDYFTLPGLGQYLVMDFIEGEDLRQRIERVDTLPEEDVIVIGAHICDALQHLHTRTPPIIHRDIKPGNIKVTPEGDVVLVDFGLAKIMQENQNTTTGARAMTPGYSPPEQYGTAHTDSRSDIYSLGATLYAALTGVIPEDGLTRLTGKTRLTPIRDLRAKVNRKLAAVIEEALSLDPDDRFQSAEEFKKALLESGNVAHKFQERNTVTPPPEESLWQPASEEGKGSLQPLPRSSAPISSRARRQAKKRSAYLLMAITGIIGVIVLTYTLKRPPNLGGLIGQVNFTQTPSLAVSPTQDTPKVLASLTSLPQAILPIPSETPAPLTAVIKTPSPTATPLGGGFSQIAFSSNRTGDYQIWLMDADGTDQKQITGMHDGACQPSWSPDGKQLAFISPCPGRRDLYPGASIYVMNADGSDQRLLPLPPSVRGDFDPTWSPDGNQIAFTSLRDGRSQIFVFDLTNSLLSLLSNTLFPDKQPAWQPSGMQLAFIRQTPNGQVWTMDKDGKHQAQFSPSGGINNLWPTWSRDGQYIFYNQTSVDVFTPWLIGLRYEDRNTGREVRIPNSPDQTIGPIAKVDFSPDGMWVAFESWPEAKNHDIYIMNVSGANLVRLTSDPAFDFDPVWRPTVTAP